MRLFKSILLLITIPAALSLTGCKKDDDNDNNSSGGGITVNSEAQASFKLDGASTSMKEGVSGVQQSFSNSGSIAPFPDTSESKYGAGFNDANLNTIFRITKGTLSYIVPADSAEFHGFFAKQSYSYSPDAEDGIRIEYYDSAGNLWATDQGTGNQSGSTFVIEDNKHFTFMSEHYVTVKASFNCTVYDGLGNSKVITNGVTVLDFWADY
jgi:hypothetical protein